MILEEIKEHGELEMLVELGDKVVKTYDGQRTMMWRCRRVDVFTFVSGDYVLLVEENKVYIAHVMSLSIRWTILALEKLLWYYSQKKLSVVLTRQEREALEKLKLDGWLKRRWDRAWKQFKKTRKLTLELVKIARYIYMNIFKDVIV